MTIKELETKTGMARANIRFYEEEGLLRPRRLSNGYRDYSDEDARTLEKIRLLRLLRLDLDTIRRVQRGALPLERALSAQTARMAQDADALRRAAEVCRALEQSGVVYAALEPRPWLERIEAPRTAADTAPRLAAQDVREQALCACDHPWRRLGARGLDTALCGTLLRVLWTIALRRLGLWPAAPRSVPGLWVWGLAALLFALAAEPFWLHFWGWTPGKWLFGLKLRAADGNRLTLRQARARCRRVAWEGCGLLLPVWHLWTLWRAYREGLDGRDSPWDGEEGFRYTAAKARRAAAPCFAGALVLCAAAPALCALLSQAPPNQGPLTVRAFSRNYSYYRSGLLAADEHLALPVLEEDGRWAEAREPGVTFTLEETFNGVPVTGGTVWANPQFTLRDGKITAVTLRWESNRTVLFPGGTRETLALLALSGASDGAGPLRYGLRDWLELAERFGTWESWTAERRGVSIVQQTEMTGYHDEGAYLIAAPGKTPRFEGTVTISLSGA